MPKQRLINVNEPVELRAWARYWCCTQQDILDAVKVRGSAPGDVLDWLKVNVVR